MATFRIDTSAWNRVNNTPGFSFNGTAAATPIAAPVTLPASGVSPGVSTSGLTYYVRFELSDGTFITLDQLTHSNGELFQLSSFSLGDTQTLNIGSQSSGAGAGKVAFGPLQLSFTQAGLDPRLFQILASGRTIQEVDVLGYNLASSTKSLAVDYSFGLVGASLLTTDQSGTTQLGLQYGAQEIQQYNQKSDGSYPSTPDATGAWDAVTNTSGFKINGAIVTPVTASTTLPQADVFAGGSNPKLNYYVRFTLFNGSQITLNGNQLFALSQFSLGDTQTLNIGSQSTGAGAGKVAFNNLNLSFAQPGLDPQLLTMLASGAAFEEVDVLGYDPSGNHLVTDDSFGLVAASQLTTDQSGITQLSLQYGAQEFQQYIKNASGSYSATPDATSSWNRVNNAPGFSFNGTAAATPIAAPVTFPASGVSPGVSTSGLTYYVRFELSDGTFITLDQLTHSNGELFQLSSFSLGDTQTLNIGSQSSGAGAGKVAFGPLQLSFTQAGLDPRLFQILASGAVFQEVDVLGYNLASSTKSLAVDYSFGLVGASLLTTDQSGTTQLGLQYGAQEIQQYNQKSDGSYPSTPDATGAWDAVTNTSGFKINGAIVTPVTASTTLPQADVFAGGSNPKLNYYVRFTLFNGSQITLNGNQLFALSQFSLGDTQTLNIGSQSTGAGAGKVAFNNLNLSFAQPGLDPQLLTMLASGAAFEEVDVLGYDPSGNHLVADDSFGLVAASQLTTDQSGITQLSLQYGAQEFQQYIKNASGSYSATPDATSSWNRVNNAPGFSFNGTAAATPIAAPVTLPASGVSPGVSTSGLTYYVRFELSDGTFITLDQLTHSNGELFQLSSFSLGDTQTLNIGSQSSGAGAGKVAFGPLQLSFTQAGLDPRLFQILASGAVFQEVDVLGYNLASSTKSLAVDYSFGLVGASLLTTDQSGTTQLGLQYGAQEIQQYNQKSDGSYPSTPDSTGAWDAVTNTSGFKINGAIVTPVTASTTLPQADVFAGGSNPKLNYYVRFTLFNGSQITLNGNQLFALSQFSLGDTQTLNIGSQSTGAGAGKVAFNNLNLSFAQPGLDPQLLTMLASGAAFEEVDVLGYDPSGNHLVTDDSFGLVAASQLTTDQSGITQLSLQYGSQAYWVDTPNVNTVPVVTAPNFTATHNQNIAAIRLFTETDADHDTPVAYQFWDSTTDPASGYWVVGGVAQAAGVAIDVTPAQLTSATFQARSGSDTVFVRANDGTVWSAWTQFHINAPIDNAPVSTPKSASVTASHNQISIAASSLFGVTDADGDTITKYALWDTGGSGHWSVNGVAQAAGVEIDITAAQWAQTTYVFGAVATSSDLLYVRANDGSLWGSWTSALTASPGPDQAPVTSPVGAGVIAAHGQTSIAASSLFGVTDADGDAITTYALWDTGGSGHWSVNGVAQAAGVEIDITAAQWAQTTYVFGAVATSSDLLYVRANDGSLWGSWTSALTASPGPDQAPVTSPVGAGVIAAHGQTSIAASSLFHATDADGDAITKYALWDTGGSGHWSVNGVAQAAGVEIDITAAQWAQTTYVFGAVATSSDLLYVRANDGSLWGSWTSALTASPGPDQAPVTSPVGAGVIAAHGQTSIAASSLFHATDADGDTITKYALWDTGGSGHWSVNGVAQAAGVEIDITAAQWAQTTYVFGAVATSSDLLYVRANDGSLWGSWTSALTASPGPDQAPVTSPVGAGVIAAHGQTSIAASSLFHATDADGDAITTYALWDTGGSGHWSVNGVAQAAGVEIDITAAQWAQTTYVFGAVATSSDLLYVRANDGSLWGSWTSALTASPGPDQAPVTSPVGAGVIAAHGQTSIAASSLFHATDADGDTITKYALWDTGGNGHWSVNGVAQAAGVEIDITAAQWAQTTYVFGAPGTPSDLLYVRANDGSLWGSWMAALTATPGPDQAPVVTAANTAIASGRSVAASSLFTASDPDGDTLKTYAFWDSSTNGHFTVGGLAKPAATEIDVTAAQLATTSYVAGSGTDQLYVRVSDGMLWSAWQAFTAGPVAPVVTASNLTTLPAQTLAASNLFKVSDPDAGTLSYAFWDSSTNGHFTVGGVTKAAATEIDVTAAQLATTSYVAGSGTDQLYVKVSEGTLSSPWQAFTATGITPANINAGATLELGSAYANPVTFLGSTGTLKFDNAASFAGTVAGMTAQDTIDFANINFVSIQTPTYLNGTSGGGTLHVTDGTHTANIALLGNYLASTFVASSDGHGGTSVIDPPAIQASAIAPPLHA